MVTDLDHYTSTGLKFWRHEPQMQSYREGTGRTIISTHVSPVGACNLKCPYCSVSRRDLFPRLEYDTIIDYLVRCRSRGLKAVIFTGGGEPTLHPCFNEMVAWCADLKLKIGLITNGTRWHWLSEGACKALTWVRISVNLFEGWMDRISVPRARLSEVCTVGMSFVATDRHELSREPLEASLNRVVEFANAHHACYLRVLPDCLLQGDELAQWHARIQHMLSATKADVAFHQEKLHRAPQESICHQSYFRPYLSEAIYHKTGKPGTVYPCDSVVLNEAVARFEDTWALCAPHEILDYLDGRIKPPFDPRESCPGCVFTKNVEMLGRWKRDGQWLSVGPIVHEDFP